MMNETNVEKKAPSTRKSSSKVTPPRIKSSSRKKSDAKKKAPVRKSKPVTRDRATENIKAASSSRVALVSKLRADLKASTDALKAARVAAREELKLVKTAAKDEIAVLRDQLAAVVKREKELMKMSKNKTAKMIAAGERWEKEQLARIKKIASQTRRKISR